MAGNGGTWRLTRPKLAFGLGALTLAHEVVIRQGPERPWILLAALTLCGVASFVKADELLKGLAEVLQRPPTPDEPKELEHGGTAP